MTTLSLPPIVAAGVVTDSLGREWDPLKHPRGRDGKFIHTFKRIRAFLNAMDTDPWMTGEVTNINNDGSIRVRIKKTTDPNLVDPASGKSYVEQQVDITPDLVESINEKAVLGKDPNELTPAVFKSLGFGDEMTTWKSFRARHFPDFAPFAVLGKIDLDNAISSLRNALNNNQSIEQWDADFKESGGHDFIRDAAKYMIATRALNRSATLNGDGDKDVIHSNDKFRAVLEQLGVDPDVIDDTPDGLSGFDELAGKIRAWRNSSTGLDRAPRTPGASREVEFGEDGNVVAFFGVDHGGPDTPMTLRVIDKDGNIDPRSFNTFNEAREAALEPKASLEPEASEPTPPPEPDEIDAPEVDDEPTDADLEEIDDELEQITDIDTTDVREIAQDIHMSESEYGETYADSINGIASGVEEGSYSVEEARAELRSLAGEIGDEADDLGSTELEKLAKNLRAIADNLGVTKKAELDTAEELDDEEDVVEEEWTPEQLEVLDEYVSASQDINDTLRDIDDDVELEGGLKQFTDTMDEVIDSYALTESTKLYRGINAADDAYDFAGFLASLHPGKTIREKGYMSTSVTPDVAENFTKTDDNDTPGIFLEIDAPEGAAALPVNATPFSSSEDEMLLPRNSRLYIETVEKDDDGVTRVRARLLGTDEPDPIANNEIDIPAGVDEQDAPVDTNPDQLMTSEQKAAITSYQGDGARMLNAILRDNKSGNLDDIDPDKSFYEHPEALSTKRNVHQMTKDLESLIDEYGVSQKGAVLSRGMVFNPKNNKDFIAAMKPGFKFTDRGFMSTSKNHDVAESFSNKASQFKTMNKSITFSLEVEDDIKGLDIDEFGAQAGLYEMGEEEVLLPRNVQIAVDDVQLDEDGNMHVLARLRYGNDDDSEIPEAPEDSTPAVQEEAPVTGPEQDGPSGLDTGPGDSGTSPEVEDTPAGPVDVPEDGQNTPDTPTWTDDDWIVKKPSSLDDGEAPGDPFAPDTDPEPIDNEPLADWEKELLYGDDWNDSDDFTGGSTAQTDLPGPDSEEWEKMVDDKGAFRYDQSGKKIRVGDKVTGADGVEMTISKFESNNKGVIALDADGKKRIRHRKKLNLVAPSTASEEPADTPAVAPESDAPKNYEPNGDNKGWASWADDSTEDFAWQIDGFINDVYDGNVGDQDFFNAGDGYLITYDKDKKQYKLWIYDVDTTENTLLESYQATDNGLPPPGFSASLLDSIKAHAFGENDFGDSDPVPSDNYTTPTVMAKTSWENQADLTDVMKDAKIVAGPGSWPSNGYIDLGDGYELRWEPQDNNFEVHNSETGEISIIGKPSDSADDLAMNINSAISSNQDNDPLSPTATASPQSVYVNTDSDFDNALAIILDSITYGYYNNQKIYYGAYRVDYNEVTGDVELRDAETLDLVTSVDVGEGFNTIASVILNSIHDGNDDMNPANTPDLDASENAYPGPSGTQNVFSTWENSLETFAYDFAGFENDVLDGNTGPNDYFDAGDGYTVTFFKPSDEFVLWNFSNGSGKDHVVGVFSNNVDAAKNIQQAIKNIEIGDEPDSSDAPASSAVPVYSWKDELTAINDIPKNLPGVLKLFSGKGLTAYQVKQYRNAGFALDDAQQYEIDSPEWNQAVNKAIYNLTQAGPEAALKLAQVNQWRTDALNAHSGGVIENNTPASDITLPEGFQQPGPFVKSIYYYSGDSIGSMETYAVVYQNGDVFFHNKNLGPAKALTTEELLINHPKWSPYGGVSVSESVPPTAGPLSLPNGYEEPDGTVKAIYSNKGGYPGMSDDELTYAVVYDDGTVTYHYASKGTLGGHGGSKVMPNISENDLISTETWIPYAGNASEAPTPGPDLSQPHKLDMNGNAMFIGDTVHWSTKGVDVTITGFEKNDVGVIVTSIGPGGKPKKHALNRKKLMLKKSTQHAHTQPANKTGPPKVVSSNLVSKKVDPDPNSPWFGVAQPEKPELDVPDGLGDGKLVDDAWMQKVNENYKKGAKAENPSWVEKDISQSLTYSQYYLPAQKGNKERLANLRDKGWITQELYDDALAQIEKNSKIQQEALEKNNALLAKWRTDVKAWRIANGLPIIQLKGMDEGVIKLDNSGAKAWMNKNQKPGSLTPQGQLSGPSYSAVSSQKSSNISGSLRSAKEKTLDPEWIATHAGYTVLGMDQAMLDSPPLQEDFMVTRTLDMGNFINPATGMPYITGDALSNSAGSIQHDWGFAETSVGSYDAGATVGYGAGRAIRMQLRVPKGTRGVWTLHPSQSFGFGTERGFILERGLAYYIHSVNWKVDEHGHGYWAVNAEVIPKDVDYDQFGHFINENPFFD